MKTIKSLGLIWLCIFCNLAQAEGSIIAIEGATIRGNQELPTVLYLVPWQPAKVYSLEKEHQTLASSRPFKKLERASFKRMLSYHETFLKKGLSK